MWLLNSLTDEWELAEVTVRDPENNSLSALIPHFSVVVLRDLSTSDFDADGCTDAAELGGDEVVGGSRDPLYYWDFFDQWLGAPPAQDGTIVTSDISAVVARFGTFRESTPTKQEALVEAQTPPTDISSYHPSGDRGPGLVGPNPWNPSPPDGSITTGDIGAVVAQFGHTCA